MPEFRELANAELRSLPKRELSRRDRKTLAQYRGFVRDMLDGANGKQAALQLSEAEIIRVATVKRWLRRAAREEGVRISVKKRGEFLIFEAAD